MASLSLFLSFCLSLLIYKGVNSITLKKESINDALNSQAIVDVIEEFGVGAMAISIVTKNDSFFKGWGSMRANSQKNVTEETIFGIGSISKTFVAVGFEKAFGGDISRFETDISDYLPLDLKPKDEIIGNYQSENGYPKLQSSTVIKIKHLLTHTSGHDENFVLTSKKYNTLEEDLIANMPVRIREPGKHVSYNNYGTALAAYILGRIENKQYDEVVVDMFNELKMNNTYYGYDNAIKDENMCNLVHKENGKVVEYPVDIQRIAAQPAGVIYSPHKDMKKYVRMFLANQTENSFLTDAQRIHIFSQEYKVGEQIPGFTNLLYPHDVYSERYWGHMGDLGPFYSAMEINLEKELGIVITFSSTGAGITDGPRGVILKILTMALFKEDNYCESKNGTIDSLRKNDCYSKVSLSTTFPRNPQINYKEKYSEMIGTFEFSRYGHTNWFKSLHYFIFSNDAMKVSLYEDKYLSFQMYFTSEQFLLVESPYSNSSNDFLIVSLVDKDTVEYVPETFDSLMSFKKEDGKKYWYKQLIILGYEYTGSNFSITSKWVFIMVTLFGFPVTLVIFTILLCCSIISWNCIFKFVCLSSRNCAVVPEHEELKPMEELEKDNEKDNEEKNNETEKKEQITNEEKEANVQNEEEENKKEENQAHSLGKTKEVLLRIYYVILLISLIFIGLSLFSSSIHYASLFVSLLEVILVNNYDAALLKFFAYLPIFSIISFSISVILLIIGLVIFLFFVFLRTPLGARKITKKHLRMHIMQFVFAACLIGFGILISVLYFRLIWLINVFAHY